MNKLQMDAAVKTLPQGLGWPIGGQLLTESEKREIVMLVLKAAELIQNDERPD